MKNLPSFEEFINEEYSIKEKNFSINKIEKQIDENEGIHSFGCAMMYFNNPKMNELHKQIKEEDIYIDDEDPSFGLEKDPHVTLLYGLHDDEIESNDIIKVISECEIPKTMKLENISIFESDKYDVLKFDINEDLLNVINKKLCEFPYTSDYPDYHAHSTIGYIKKGKGKEYVELFKNENCEVEPNKIVYSKPNGKKIEKKI